MRRRRSVEPPVRPPRGVEVVLSDGTRVPCELFYVGTEHDFLDPDPSPIHVWEVTAAVPSGNTYAIHCDFLPARTTLRWRQRL